MARLVISYPRQGFQFLRFGFKYMPFGTWCRSGFLRPCYRLLTPPYSYSYSRWLHCRFPPQNLFPVPPFPSSLDPVPASSPYFSFPFSYLSLPYPIFAVASALPSTDSGSRSPLLRSCSPSSKFYSCFHQLQKSAGWAGRRFESRR